MNETEAIMKLTSSLLTLLDRIEMETSDDTTYDLCQQRFQIAKDCGLTVEFGEPVSGAVH